MAKGLRWTLFALILVTLVILVLGVMYVQHTHRLPHDPDRDWRLQVILGVTLMIMVILAVMILVFLLIQRRSTRQLKHMLELERLNRRSQERYQALAESSTDMIFVVDRQGNLDYLNGTAATALDIDRSAALGAPLSQFFPPDVATGQQMQIQAVLDTRQPVNLVNAFPFGEEIRWLDTSLVPLHDGSEDPVAVMGVARDVTEQRRLMENLRRSEERFRTVFEQSRIGKVITAPDGRLLQVNPTFAKMVGYSIDELHELDFAQITHPDDLEASREELLTLLEGTKDSARFEKRYVHRGGHVVWTSVSSHLLRDDTGAPVYFITSVMDISEMKAAMASLEQSNLELEQFAYVASHDLQEPLRMVASFTQLLQQRYEGQLDEKADRYIHFAVDGARRMQRLINALLELSRVGTRGSPPKPVDSDTVLDEVLRDMQPTIDEAGATVKRSPLPAVMADPDQLGLVFQNLVGNAIKFRGDDPPVIEIEGSRRGSTVELCIRDNGIGMNPAHVERIFQVFQRLHERDRYPGTGIGLAVVKKIVDRHEGTVAVDTAPGEGSRFCVTLPAAINTGEDE